MEKSTLILSLLKMGDDKTITTIYNTYRIDFLKFGVKYQLANDVLVDVYQDAIIALCENAKKGLLDTMECSIKTYLFSIGKYMIFKVLKTKTKVEFEYTKDKIEQIEWDFFEEESQTKEIELLQQGFTKLGDQCKKVLQLFYYEEKNLDEIVELLNYSSKEVLKSQKSRCLKKLKDLAK